MIKIAGKTYWLIGASEGLGRELAKLLADGGAKVIVSARNAARLEDLSEHSDAISTLPLDVMDLEAVKTAAATIGEIDGLIYCAGAYEPMPATAWDTEAVLRMSDINYTGALRVLGETVPQFVERGSGDITLIGSLSAYRGLPNAIGYGSSKSALQSLAETMRFDLAGSGVLVRIVNPGFIETRLTQKNNFKMPQLMSAKAAAKRVLKAMKRRRFRTDFPRPFSWVIRLITALPDWIVYRGK
ncbi:putative oxidoreductase [Cognatishimia activa]|uniref:Putative oxidoreductase n=1 Tax=Cognatishimia activa TaxID=1715691 RepID=A0A0P1IV46_9RHOB|nr:SDR family NAD(P)-dependent oxidoreductase [Cognatishimia activa]CUK27502.1 putative oxidoreductase [Cognatishimia activa]